MYMHTFSLLLMCVLLTLHTSAFPGQPRLDGRNVPSFGTRRDAHSGTYRIPSVVQDGDSKANFDIRTPTSVVDIETLFNLDAPQIDSINGSVFDWWYFDAVSETNPGESLVITFFASSVAAFPFLDANETSVTTAYVWASFANGTVFAGSVPATFATVAGVDGAGTNSSGEWHSTGFSWAALTDNLSKYEVVIVSESLQVKGRLTLTSRAPPHLPCGIHAEETTLKIAPHIGWVSLIPDAMAEVGIEIQGSMLKFQGPGYHDKNWSDRPFLESVQSWYWGHGHIGPYSIAWFSYLALDDPTNTTYVSSYIARDGVLLVSTCDPNILTVHPTGNPGTTGARYPPRVGDIPEGFRLEYDLGTEGHLNANVSIRAIVAGDGENYMRWTGDLVGEVISSVGGQQEGRYDPDHRRDANKPIDTQSPSSLTGVAVLEQFILIK